MKKFIYSLVLMVFVSFTSCQKISTEDTSKITYYATLELEGAKTIIIKQGEAYVEPGYIAIQQSKDVSDQVVIEGNIDINTPGIYGLKYVITNEDGFGVTDSRTVMVASTESSPLESGFWKLQDGSERDYLSGTITPFSGFEVTILQLSADEYYISDFIGGYYDQRAGYGSAYAMTGKFKLNADNTITALESYVAGWGDSMDSMTAGKFDPTNGLSWNVAYAGSMTFKIILKK